MHGVRVLPALLACLSSCPLVAGGAGNSCYFAGVSKIAQYTARCSVFYLLYCFALGALIANVALFRALRAFLEGFMGFVWVCVVLALCVDCGAFVCVNS